MNSTTQPLSKEPTMPGVRPEAGQAVENLAPPTASEKLATDMVMLQKADLWMSQFKTRLNIGIIAMVVLWGSVSYYKGMEMHLEAKAPPEAATILADGSMDADHAAPADKRHQLEADAQTEPPLAAEKASQASVKGVKPKVVKKSVAKLQKSKSSGGKVQSRNQKKLKKTLAAKPAA